MKKSMKWNILGILALVVGLSSGMTVFYGNSVFRIGDFYVQIGSPFVIVISLVFSSMCFVFGLIHGLFKDQ